MQEQAFNFNGTNIYAFTNTALSSFCVALYIKAGSLFEEDRYNGISHLFEHIVFRNLKKKFPRFYDLLKLNGLDFSGMTYKEFICFSINGPEYGFDFAVDILCSVFDEINISVEELNFEKARIKAEKREENYMESLDHLFSEAVWKGTNSEKAIIGKCKILDAISLKKLNEYREDILSRDNCFFYVTGNVTDKGIEKLGSRISKLNISEKRVQHCNTVVPCGDHFRRDGRVAFKNGYWCYVKIGFDTDTQRFSGGVYDVLYSLMFTAENSLVNMCLSEDTPLIYSYSSTHEMYDNVGVLSFKFEIIPEKVEEGISRIVDMINRIKRGDFDFEASLKWEISRCVMDLDNPPSLNWHLAYHNHILKTEPVDYTKEDMGRYNGVTKEQVIRAAKEIFRISNLTVAIKGPRKKIKTERVESILKQL